MVVIYRVMNSQGVSEIRRHSVIKTASLKKSSQNDKIFHKNNLNIHRGLKIYLNVELELSTHTDNICFIMKKENISQNQMQWMDIFFTVYKLITLPCREPYWE